MVFFQRYYWHKKSHPVFSKSENTSDLFPILVDHTYRDCLAGVRPKLKLYKNLEEAKEAIDQLQEQLYPQLKACSNNNNAQDSSLDTINEINELDDGVSRVYISLRRSVSIHSITICIQGHG